MKGSTVIRLAVVVAVLGVGWWYFLRPADKGPWSISVAEDFTYTSTASVGDDVRVSVKLTNSGSASSAATKFQLSDLAGYADLARCVPDCSLTSGPDTFAVLPGIAAGATATYTVQLIAKKVGAVHWTLCVYDAAAHGNQVYCGAATTVVR